MAVVHNATSTAAANRTSVEAVQLSDLAHPVTEFQFSDLCRIYSADPYIVVADHRLSSSSSPHFLYLPSENPTIVFVDSLKGVQAIAKWSALKEPCALPANAPFVVRECGSSGEDKGLGMFATRPLKRGALITHERPIYISHPALAIAAEQVHAFQAAALAGLSVSSQAALASLHNAQPAAAHGPIHGRVLTNALPAALPHAPGTRFAALFPTLCRANHACVPNAYYAFCKDTCAGRLFALRAIAEGEEITIGYTDLLAPRETRRARLQAGYGFNCECATCGLSGARAVESDKRRAAIEAYVGGMRKDERIPEGATLARAKELMLWAEEEGLVEGASILGVSALRLARREGNRGEEFRLTVRSMNYIRALEGNESPGFVTLAGRIGLSSDQLAAILDKSTPETIDYKLFEQLLVANVKR